VLLQRLALQQSARGLGACFPFQVLALDGAVSTLLSQSTGATGVTGNSPLSP
jgi:hypothetical protein